MQSLKSALAERDARRGVPQKKTTEQPSSFKKQSRELCWSSDDTDDSQSGDLKISATCSTNANQKRNPPLELCWCSSSDDGDVPPQKRPKRPENTSNDKDLIRVVPQSTASIRWYSSSDDTDIPSKPTKLKRPRTTSYSEHLKLFATKLSKLPKNMVSISNIVTLSDPAVVVFDSEQAAFWGLSEAVLSSIPKKGISHAYSGNQFGIFVPHLGDGRCSTFEHNGVEVNIKGSGRTEFSRNFDGKLGAASACREYVMSKFILKNGGPSTSTIAVLASTTAVIARERAGLEPQAVLLRCSSSWIRFGTLFQLLYHSRVADATNILVGDSKQSLASALTSLAERTANTTAWWQSHGLYHGTLNTDNLLINGVTVDHSSSEFLRIYDPSFCSNTVDVDKMYRFGNQPSVVRGHVERLSRAFSLDSSTVAAILKRYDAFYDRRYLFYTVQRWGLIPSKECCDSMGHLISGWVDILKGGQPWLDLVDAIASEEYLKYRVLVTGWSDWVHRFQQASEGFPRLARRKSFLFPPDMVMINKLADSKQWAELNALVTDALLPPDP